MNEKVKTEKKKNEEIKLRDKDLHLRTNNIEEWYN